MTKNFRSLIHFLFPLMMMADEPGAGGPPAAVGEVPPKEGATPPQSGTNNEPNELEQLRAELARERSELKRISDEKRAKEEELENGRVSALKAQNDWQKVAQEFEGKYNQIKTEKENTVKAFQLNEKTRALREAAIKSGILDTALDDLDMLDFPEMKLETTNTGRVKVLGTDAAVQRLKSLRPHWFQKTAPNVNGGAPRVTDPETSDFDAKEMIKLENEARKSGDWSRVSAYRDKHFGKRA